MNNYFANNLKHLRKQTGMTQDELAKKMNKDYSTIGKWELGQRNPAMIDMIKLSDIFNVPVQDMVEKDLMSNDNNNDLSELDILFSKHKDKLTEGDEAIIKAIIEQRMKEIDKELDGE